MNQNENWLARSLRAAAKIEQGELAATLQSFSFIFTLMASYYILRPIRDAMSSDWSDAELSTLFTATFLFSIVAVSLYGVACSRIRFRRLVPGVYGFFALSFLAFYFASQADTDPGWIRKVFYVWVSVFSLFHVSVFWSYMADVFSRQQAQRLFGFIAAGASIGAIVGPGIAVAMAGVAGPRNLVLVSAGLLLVPMMLVGSLENGRAQPHGGDQGDSGQRSIGGNPFAGFSLFLKSPYLLGIGLFIFLYTAISTFVYFELKNLLAGVEEANRVAIWAGIDLAVNILAIVTAMFATSRLTTRFGLTATLIVVPLVIVVGLITLAFSPIIAVVVVLQIVRRAGNYAITRPGREMLFTVVDRETRFKAKSVIDIVVYRGGDAITAWAFTGLTAGFGIGLGAVAAVGAGIAAVWVGVAVYLGRSYETKTERDAGAAVVAPGVQG
ncbi:MAG: MFS transporter [Chromatiales bacterium]|nr:MFS transporter [Chromatiales bacterium]